MNHRAGILTKIVIAIVTLWIGNVHGAEPVTKGMLYASYGILHTCWEDLRTEFRSENAPRAKLDFLNQTRIKLAMAPSLMVDGREIDANHLIFNQDQSLILVYTDINTTESEWSKNLLAQCKVNVLARLNSFGF